MSKKKENNKKLILKLRDIRREKGLSLQTLANKAGLAYQKVGRVERGETQITVDTLYRLAKVLDVPLSKMLEEGNLSELKNNLIKNGNTADIYIIPDIYGELDTICKKYNVVIENTAKVKLATIVFKVIQDIHTNVKGERDLVRAFFQGLDAIFERFVLSRMETNDAK